MKQILKTAKSHLLKFSNKLESSQHVFLLDEILQTSASNYDGDEQNCNLGRLRDILCNVSAFMIDQKAFFIPHNWEKFSKYRKVL